MEPTSNDPATNLNEALSEVIDLVQDVKQARRKVPGSHALHDELDQLFIDLGAWAQLLFEQDEALGFSALTTMPSVAGRTPTNLWPGEATDEQVRTLIDEHLERLAEHVTAAIAAQDDGPTRAALAGVEAGVSAHRTTLRRCRTSQLDP
jgi:DNA-binding ferritin-like protein